MAEPPVFPPHIEETLRSIAKLDIEHHESATRPQRWVDRVTDLLGQPRFLGVVTIGIIAWIGLNELAPVLGVRAIDPAPFTWVESLVALGEFYIVVLILITQRREEQLAQHHARLTLQLTILGEQKIAKVIALLEEFRRDNPLMHNRVDPVAEAMSESPDPNTLLDALKEPQAREPGKG